jgi:dienelactone hydrolase
MSESQESSQPVKTKTDSLTDLQEPSQTSPLDDGDAELDSTSGILRENLSEDEVELLSEQEEPYGDDLRSSDQTTPTFAGEPLSSGASPPPLPPLKGQKFTLSGTRSDIYISDTNKSLSPSGSSKIVILLTNSLGLESDNNLRLADTYSQKLQCPVIVPDLFDKDPIKTSGAEVPDNDLVSGNKISLSLDNVKSWAINAVKGFMDEMWLAKHTFEHTYPQVTNILAEIVQIYRPISLVVIGYAFGARYVFRLLEDRNNDAWSSEEDLISAGVAINPSLATLDDLRAASKPIFLAHSSNDELLDQGLLDRAISIWKNKNVDYSTLTCTGPSDGVPLPHGFAVPGDYPSTVVGDWPSQVVDQVVKWIQEHLD